MSMQSTQPAGGKRSGSDLAFDIVNTLLLSIALLTVLYPLYYIVIASVSDPNAVNTGKVILLPVDLTIEGYKKVFAYETLWQAYGNTIKYVLIGTSINLALTLTGAYALSRRELAGRRFFMLMITFTMIFSGGLIPTFLTVKGLGMYNTMWALVIPNAIGAYNFIVARTFFETSIPYELVESANIDGCSDIRFFLNIVLPLSPAIIAVMILFYGVAHWNSFFNALIYLKDRSLNPLQLELRELLITQQAIQNLDAESIFQVQRTADIMKFAAIIVSSVPIIAVYPFLQRFFVKGVMIGAIKG